MLCEKLGIQMGLPGPESDRRIDRFRDRAIACESLVDFAVAAPARGGPSALCLAGGRSGFGWRLVGILSVFEKGYGMLGAVLLKSPDDTQPVRTGIFRVDAGGLLAEHGGQLRLALVLKLPGSLFQFVLAFRLFQGSDCFQSRGE